jgi:outer membrane protein assembly factor BamB
VPSSSTAFVKEIHFPLQYYPQGIACRSNGEIAVTGNQNQMHIYKQDGRNIVNATLFSQMRDIASNENNLYMTTYGNGQVYVYDKNNDKQKIINVHFNGMAGIAVTNQHMYVTSGFGNNVFRLDMPHGENKRVFISSKRGLRNPIFAAANGGLLAVVSRENNKIFVFDMQGASRYIIDNQRGPANQQSFYRGIALDSNGNLIYTDSSNRLVRIVSPKGKKMYDIDLEIGGLKIKIYPDILTLSKTGQLIVVCSKENDEKVVAIYQKPPVSSNK